MVVEALLRPFAVAAVERVQNGAVFIDDEGQAAHPRREPVDSVDTRLGDLDRAPYPSEVRGRAEGAMELLVDFMEALEVSVGQGRGLIRQDLPRLCCDFGRPRLGHATQHSDFEGLSDEMVVANRAELDRRDEAALLREDFDQLVLDEPGDRTAHRSARNADLTTDAVLAD